VPLLRKGQVKVPGRGEICRLRLFSGGRIFSKRREKRFAEEGDLLAGIKRMIRRNPDRGQCREMSSTGGQREGSGGGKKKDEERQEEGLGESSIFKKRVGKFRGWCGIVQVRSSALSSSRGERKKAGDVN